MFGSSSMLATVIPMIFAFSLLAFLMQLGSGRKRGGKEARTDGVSAGGQSHSDAHHV